MAPIDEKEHAERRMRRLLEDCGLPEPDEVVYGERSIELLWHEHKVAVVVDLDEFGERDAHGGYEREGVAG
jgi:hypothetical protein